MGAHHNHSHGHDHHHHGSSSLKKLIISIVLIGIFAGVEAVGGWWAHSLALIGDAGHMGSDALALMIAAFAAWIALKPPSKQHSYGLGRAEVIAAWISSLSLLVISVFIIVEAVKRINYPPSSINSVVVMVIAGVGIFINLAVAWILSRGEQNINVRAALTHVLSDLLASFAALVTGAVIYYTGWLMIDPILSILIGVLIMFSSIRLLRESMLILMESVPNHINMHEVEDTMYDVDGVKDIHDLHVWTLSSGKVALSAHVDINDLDTWNSVLSKLKTNLKEKYSIAHVTLQPEPEVIDCEPCNGRVNHRHE